MVAVAPFAILLGGCAALALIFGSLWQPVFGRFGKVAPRFAAELEAAGMRIEPQRFMYISLGITAVLWSALALALRPQPWLAAVLLGACGGLVMFGGRSFVRRKRKQRLALFRDQLEGSLRTLAGGVRVGLGIRQALVLTSEQSREPAKSEFMRVVGLSNLGMSTLDAFDQLALRMQMTETAVLARVIRVQSQTGGDLGSVLEGLAGTIRDRRRLRRRVSAVTAQGRATAWLLGLLPLAVGGFVLTQGELRDAMLFTPLGQIMLGAALVLDAVAIYALTLITKIEA